MATETEIPAADTVTKVAEIESHEETLAPSTLDVSAPSSENLTATVSPSTIQEKSQTASGDTGEVVNGGLKAKEEQNLGNGVTNDTEKKIRRAERFGVPLQLSEEEKRNSRAERFGTLSGSGTLKSSEELKRKARAERFGPVANSVVDNGAKKNSAVDNDAKKKARLARFGSNAKIDSQEEEKRKARALRFAQSPADSQTKTDCKGNVESAPQKTAVTGSAIGGT